MAVAIGGQRCRVHHRHNVGAGHCLGIVTPGAIAAQIANSRLAVDLIAVVDHRAMEGLHQVGRLRRAKGMCGVHAGVAHRMVVVTPAIAVVMAALVVQALPGTAIGLHEAIDGVSIQGPGGGLVIAQRATEAAVKVRWHDVIVVVIGQPAVAAVDVEFSDFIGDIAAVVGGIEDGHAIGGQGHGAAQKVGGRGRWIVNGDRRGRGHGHQRDAPDIGLLVAEGGGVIFVADGVGKIGCGNGHLLLPGGDAKHAVGHALWHVVGFQKEGAGVPVETHLGLEGREGGRHQQAIA